MWCQIISSSSQTAISPCDDYLPVTIFCPCPKVVIISDILCITEKSLVNFSDIWNYPLKMRSMYPESGVVIKYRFFSAAH